MALKYQKKNITVSTDKEVPEEIKSSIRKYAKKNYGFTINFSNSMIQQVFFLSDFFDRDLFKYIF